MLKIFYCICLIITSMASVGYAERIMLKGGQTLEGTIVEEQTDFIRIKSGFDTIQLDKEDVLSIQHLDSLKDDSSIDDLLPEEEMDDATKMSSIQYYRETIKLLNEQINVHKATIKFLDEQLQETQQKAIDNEAKLQNEIKKLEQKIKEISSVTQDSKFEELLIIQPNKEIPVNNGYVKSVKFRISEDIDGYFIGVEYTLLSEFVRIEPNFVTYFFDKRGLNIATDTNNMKFNVIPRGHEEVITKGVPMLIPDARPYYFFIKINLDDEEQTYQ